MSVVVLISGRMYTGRDAVHHHLMQHEPPVDLRGGIVYHCGPVVAKQGDGWTVTAAGPTTSIREEPYQGEIIKRYGVRAVIGKGGMGGPNPEGLPTRHGFDYFLGYLDQKQAHSYYPTHLWQNEEWFPLRNSYSSPHQKHSGSPDDPASYDKYKGQEYSLDVMADDALRFVREHRARPFFLYLHFLDAHWPYAIPDEAAERFAKTLRSKLQRKYHELDHVRGHPFAIALADFHKSGSMVWSREALPTYLYGQRADRVTAADGEQAVMTPITNLIGQHGIPAGLFRTAEAGHLSAVIFSNAGTLAKFNRMGFLAGWRPPGLRMVRRGHIFDRTPGATASIPFDLDIASDEYASLWPGGEAWCQELEVYHNPFAGNPLPKTLLPGATHWFEQDGEIVCSAPWANSVLASITENRFDDPVLTRAGSACDGCT